MKGSTDWLHPEEPSRWYCQCFSSDGFCGLDELEELEASLVLCGMVPTVPSSQYWGGRELAGNLQLYRGSGGFRWIQIP